MHFSSCKPVLTAALLGVGFHAAWARDTVTITIPRHSSLTLVQRLNREGVEAIKKHNYAAAAKLFYKAYLYDPSDPFTLNNLGYISELEGQLDRAGKFYKLAAEQGSNANIDLSNVKSLQGEPMQAAFTSFQNGPTQVNRINLDTVNLEAVNLLSQGRSFEAVALLQQALALDPNDPFTLNNLGAANEATGDLGAAMKYYTAAANSTSHETVAVSQNRSWQGKSVNEMAAANVMRLEGQSQGKRSAGFASRSAQLAGSICGKRKRLGHCQERFHEGVRSRPHQRVLTQQPRLRCGTRRRSRVSPVLLSESAAG
jgi:Flp pilus assembly protein TadD